MSHLDALAALLHEPLSFGSDFDASGGDDLGQNGVFHDADFNLGASAPWEHTPGINFLATGKHQHIGGDRRQRVKCLGLLDDSFKRVLLQHCGSWCRNVVGRS